MNRLARPALAALLILAPAPASHGEVLISKSYQYFSIGGRTAMELDEELARRGPSTSNTNTRHPGATQMTFKGTVNYKSTEGGRCRIDSADISLHTKLILPRWRNRKGASPDLVTIWDVLSRDIKRHEERHAEIARQYARKLEKGLMDLPPLKECSAMEAAANKLSDKILDRHDRAQARFDRAEAASFSRRMARMLRFRSESQDTP
ncbi:DUF922 domain-containing Zn-dependent protease [Pseudohoeflea coraliihabitans]|uniref:DUF922 domain-containing protein n=1 Tax=Pseudohoeflea coraliihabitans TaxID=2860393 RepID=A0ABS6WQ06_9HYPH|nr:DUF922 domain-containing protein [Pseudohoeflea sp. DP4N28-3]MBW3098061.1 DUF922 domain-containing protein [Pseudohoeflea sp. DP4N28-3]